MKSIRSVHFEVGNHVEAQRIMGKKSEEITLYSDVIPDGWRVCTAQCSKLAAPLLNLDIFQDSLQSKYLSDGGQHPLCALNKHHDRRVSPVIYYYLGFP